MMRVPSYTSTQKENSVPVTQQNANVPSAAFGAPIAQGLGNAANVMQQVQDDADNLRVQDAYNQLREKQLDLTMGQKEGFTNVKGRDVMTPRAEGRSMSGDYAERFNGVGTEIEGGLSNERQKAKFRQKFAESSLDFKSGLMRHENAQITEYAKTVTNATVALETDAAMKTWNDPATIDKSIANITDSLRAQGMREGLPADALKVVIADKVSKVHAGVLASALENQNLGYADGYLKKYGRDMEAGDVLKYKGAIDKEMRTNEAVAVAHRVVNSMRSLTDPTDYDRLTTLVATQESGNRERDNNGNLITSPKGAQGKMQVMPATNKNPGYGVAPAKDDSDAERTRVGRDYLQAMLKEYGGDVNKALAAYNAGPGALDKAVKEAKGGDYLALLPKETQDYVAKIGTQFGAGATGQKRATLEDLHAGVREQMAGKPAASVKLAIDQATQLYETNLKAKKQREDDTVGEAYKQIDANGGNYMALPASIRTALPGDQIDNLQAYAAKRAKGQEAPTDWGIYYELRKDPALLKATNLMAMKGKLADTEFKELTREQEDLRTGKAESLTATRTANQVLNQFLAEANIDPTPKPSDKPDSDAAKVGRAMRAQTAAIAAAENAKGKKLTSEEIEKETAKLFTNVQVKGSWYGANEKPKFDVRAGDKLVVPAAERDLIISALKATKRPVNETMILDMYARKNQIQR